jgi:putative ABC transport system permease protein
VSKLFGIPVSGLAAALAILLGIGLGTVAAVALRNRVFVRMALRSLARRRGRSALIVVGLMLGTAIIAAALATGDTMSNTIRSSTITALGQTDEVVAARGVEAALAADNPGTGFRYFPLSYADRVARAVEGSGLVDGVAPVIVEPVAVRDTSTRQSEPRVTLFASDPARVRNILRISSDGAPISLADLRPDEVYLNADAAGHLGARAGDRIRILAGGRVATAHVRAVVRYQGGATDGSGLLMPLQAAQSLFGEPGRIRAVFVSNRGGATDGVQLSDRVVSLLDPVLSPLGLEADNTKQDALDTADTAGAAFMSIFTTFGSFSIAAGILLIFLIFVMLAAERRSELGIARAVGTRRGHLVQLFLYEGVAYDLAAAVVGALLGVAVAYGMVLAIASAFASQVDFDITFSVKAASIVVAYALGVLLTFVVVVVSAWRVSRMNISTAIRSLPEPPVEKARRRRWLVGAAFVLVGATLAVSGVRSRDAVVLGVGISVVILGLVPIVRRLGLPERVAHTGAGLALVAWFALPISRWLFGDLKVNFSIFVLGGLMIVVGSTWAIMYNADVILGALASTAGRIRAVAPVLRMSMAYPLRSLFRSGVTLAMFTLVVFTLVVGAITTGSFVHAFNDLGRFGGGFDVRATASPSSPVSDMNAALARTPGLRASDFTVVSSQSVLPVQARQLGTSAANENYLVHGVDAAFLGHTTFAFATRARGYGSDSAVWRALRTRPGLAVVDPFVVPRRSNFTMATLTDFRLRGFYLEDDSFSPVSVTIRDPQTGRSRRLTVIGVLADSVPPQMAGIWTSQPTLASAFRGRAVPSEYLFALRKGVDAGATARRIESAFLANGVEADALKDLLHDAVAASLTFDRLIMGFMGLGLIVGVAALGVIAARSVVERRQHIGVLRAIGFQRRMVQATFLLESSFIALTSIVVGTGLALAVAFNVISDSRRTPSWSGMSFEVPWLTLGVIFLVVYAVALATTYAPAVRASRVYPAEALRYQ